MERSEAARVRIRAAREDRQLTQQDVADLMGISRDYYQKVESGMRVANLRFIRQFCQVIGVSVGEIVAEPHESDDLAQKWPEGFRILRRAAEGSAWEREKLQKLFEVVYGDPNDNDKPNRSHGPEQP